MDEKHAQSDRKASQRAWRNLRAAERGDLESAKELCKQDSANDTAAVSVEQEASDGPEGRGLPR
jgi:hypothetical protein